VTARLHARRHAHTLSVPHSVSIRDYYINTLLNYVVKLMSTGVR
jgi:hypothetical protein